MQGKYHPINIIGRGTWGVVTQCRDMRTGGLVALKTFDGADKSDLVRSRAIRTVEAGGRHVTSSTPHHQSTILPVSLPQL